MQNVLLRMNSQQELWFVHADQDTQEKETITVIK